MNLINNERGETQLCISAREWREIERPITWKADAEPKDELEIDVTAYFEKPLQDTNIIMWPIEVVEI